MRAALLACIVGIAGCSPQTPPEQPPASPPPSQAEPQALVQPIPEDPNKPPLERPAMMEKPYTNMCLADASERVVSGGDRFCLSVLLATRRVEDAAKPNVKRATFRMNYYQPGPSFDGSAAGKRVGWTDMDMRVDCSTGQVWGIAEKVRSFEGDEVLREVVYPQPREAPPLPGENMFVQGACH